MGNPFDINFAAFGMSNTSEPATDHDEVDIGGGR